MDSAFVCRPLGPGVPLPETQIDILGERGLPSSKCAGVVLRGQAYGGSSGRGLLRGHAPGGSPQTAPLRSPLFTTAASPWPMGR